MPDRNPEGNSADGTKAGATVVLENPLHHSAGFSGRFLALALLLTVLISAGGWFYYRRQSDEVRATTRQALATVADLKAVDIANWARERRGDAEVARMSITIKEAAANPGDAEARAAAIERIELFRKVYGYAAVILADAQSRVRLQNPADYPLPESTVAEYILVALRSRTAVVSDLSHTRPGEPVHWWFACPVFNQSPPGETPDAALVLVIDPHQFLYPTVERWPTPSRTAETLLVLNKGGAFEYLNEPRHKTSGETFTSMQRMLVATAAQSTEGTFDAIDYRGVRVIAAVRKIAGTPWLILAKADEEEVLAPLRRDAWNVALITVLLLLASALGIASLWRRQKLVYAERELAERRRAEQHIYQLNRLYAVLSGINTLIVRERNPRAILKGACRVAVDTGNFRLAWIGMLDEETQVLKPVASAGVVDGYLDTIDIDLKNAVRGGGPAGRAVLTGEHQVCNDIATDPKMQTWRDAALQRGYHSATAFPLKIEDRTVGAFILYAAEKNFFDSDELRLLDELAGDIGFALEVNQKEVERQRAEDSLRTNEERFRSLIENTSDIITIVDRKGVFRFVSPAAQRNLGYEPEELLNRSVFDFIDPAEREQAVVAFQQMGNDPAIARSSEFRFRHRDGSWRTLETIGRSIPNHSPDGAVVVTAHDITENRKLEEQFRQSQKMEGIGQLAGGVAHDFNNILGAIMIQAELADMDQGMSDGTREGLREIRLAAERAATLTRQLLMFSRRQVMQPREIDLNEVVTGLAKMLQRIIGEDVRMQLTLSPTALITYADAGMIDQVLMNLAVNARDAMPGGGKLLIETAAKLVDENLARQIPEAAPGKHVWLSVSDTGSGIPPEVMSKIFEPFFTTKDPGKGTGLGLATVFGIVKQHRGWIKVYSEPGQGTNFQIFLPAIMATATAAETAPKPKPRGGTETILLVEDEVIVRVGTRALLERNGYRVLEAGSGVEALKLWPQHREEIALVLTDMVMPGGIGGQELARRLHEENRKLKIVFTSGYSADIAGRALELHDGENFVQKPCPPDHLLETVRKCLDGPM